jgi:hypothetical protein
MLVSKTYPADTVVCFKVVNGDEMVARILDETADEFVLDRPCTVIRNDNGLGLMQSLFSSEMEVIVNLGKKHIMYHAPVTDGVGKHYIKMLSGIETDARNVRSDAVKPPVTA